MNDNQPVEALLEQGIQAAKAKDNATARTLLEQVVEMDEHNEKAWFWLAAITDDIDEKRICLNNVLVLNPDNNRAKKLLEALDRSAAAPDMFDDAGADSGESGSGSSRKLLLLVGLVVVLLVLVGAVLVMSGGEDGNAPTANSTNTVSAMGVPTENAAASDNASAMATPAPNLPTATRIPNETSTMPPPTWTPQPSSTPVPAVPPTLFPAPPDTLPGKIVMESGNVPGDQENHPIVLMAANGSGKRLLTGDSRGHAPVLSPDSSHYAYIEFLTGMREEILKLDNIQGTDPRLASSYWQDSVRLFKPDTPAWAPDGTAIVFTAEGMGAVLPNLYRVALNNPIDQPTLEQLTEDDVIESWPAYSPDGDRIVYVADKSKLEFNNPVDLNIYDLASGTITSLTTDGSEIVESAPDWSPDGQHIVFQGQESGSHDHDIYRVPVFGLGAPEKIIDSDADDIRPRYSPNGRHIVFSSNRTGNWDVFVYDIANDTMYQLTTDVETDIANDWGR